MLLAIDVGNSNIVFGLYENNKLVFSENVKTDALRTAVEHSVIIDGILSLHGFNPRELSGVAISSVVPPLAPAIREAVRKIRHDIPFFAVGPGVKTGLNIRIDDPGELGSDLCCTSVGAIDRYPLPAIVIDLGTATKISAVDESKSFAGCSIAPGVLVSLGALSRSAALLPSVGISNNIKVIGTNSEDSMLSGSLLGTACMIDGMIDRFKEKMGDVKSIIACGGLVDSVIPHCRHEIITDHHLLLEGLISIYRKNIN